MINAKDHGWPTLKAFVAERDWVCLAIRTDVFGQDIARDQCQDKDGNLIGADKVYLMEFDHIREQAGGARIDDEAHGINVCSWHHRGSGWRSDSKEHRDGIRRYLARLYPKVWHAAA